MLVLRNNQRRALRERQVTEQLFVETVGNNVYCFTCVMFHDVKRNYKHDKKSNVSLLNK